MQVIQKDDGTIIKKSAKKVVKALENDPVKLTEMLNGKPVVRSVLGGDNLSDEEVQQIDAEVKDNNLVKLFLAANGKIDANQLVELKRMAEDTSNPTRAAGISAFFDGKLDVNDLLAVAGLLGSGSSKPQQSTGMNLLTTLLGGGTQQTQQSSTAGNLISALLGGGTTQQTQQTQGANNLLSMLLGGGTQTAQQSKPQQSKPQQSKPQSKPQQAQSANDILSLLLGGTTSQTQQVQQAQQSANPLNALFGFNTQQTTTAQNNNSGTYNLLGTLLGGSSAGNTYANQLFTLDQGTGNVTSNVNVNNANGQIDLSQLFSIAGQLLGK